MGEKIDITEKTFPEETTSLNCWQQIKEDWIARGCVCSEVLRL